MSPMYLDYFVRTTSPIYLFFDDDLGHGNHSGERLLFVGCIVHFVVSYLICMFQDSVPAGSYNDPSLSSVWGISLQFNLFTVPHILPSHHLVFANLVVDRRGGLMVSFFLK